MRGLNVSTLKEWGNNVMHLLYCITLFPHSSEGCQLKQGTRRRRTNMQVLKNFITAEIKAPDVVHDGRKKILHSGATDKNGMRCQRSKITAGAQNKQRGVQRSGHPSPTNIAPPRRAMRAERSERLRRDNKYRRAAPEPQPP